jgi:hypothetical protein
MENQFVNFKIIRRNDKGSRYRSSMLIVILSFFAFILIFDEPTPRIITGTLLFLMIPFLIFCVIKLQLLKEYEEIGLLTMTAGSIVVKTEDGDAAYAIDRSTKLTIELNGYDGEPIIGEMLVSKKGYDNFVSLTNDTGAVRYEVLVSNQMKILILDRLVNYYRRHGVVVEYIDNSSDASRKSIKSRLLMAIRHAR